jgi:hypothetical protein
VETESNAAAAARAVAPDPIITTEDGFSALCICHAFLKPITSVEYNFQIPSSFTNVFPLLILCTRGSMKSTQLSASSFRGMVSENPLHDSVLSPKNSRKLPVDTSNEEYVPDIFKNLYAAVCKRGESECEIGEPRTAALIN